MVGSWHSQPISCLDVEKEEAKGNLGDDQAWCKDAWGCLSRRERRGLPEGPIHMEKTLGSTNWCTCKSIQQWQFRCSADWYYPFTWNKTQGCPILQSVGHIFKILFLKWVMQALRLYLLSRWHGWAQWGSISHWSEWLSSWVHVNINTGESVEKREPLHCWWKCKLRSHCGEQYGGFLKEKNTKIELLCDPTIPLLGMYIWKNEKTLIGKDTHTPRFTAYSIQTWRKHKCLLIDVWLKRILYIHAKEYYLAIKKNLNTSAAAWLGRESYA